MIVLLPLNTLLHTLRAACLLLAAALLSACAPAPQDLPRPEAAQIAELAGAIRALDPSVDPEEAARAARISYLHPLELAVQYRISDPPVIHNMKVNAGLRDRGLCWHWAEDMEKRLRAEGFKTLDLHRAISQPPMRLEHSTVIISARGEGMNEGLVIDPWRKGGRLYWAPVLEDEVYEWEPRAVVLARRRPDGPMPGDEPRPAF